MSALWILAVLVSFTTSSHVPDSPGVTSLKEFIAALNSRDVSTMGQYIQAHFKPGNSPTPTITARAQRLLELTSLGTPFTFGDVLTDSPTMAIITVKNATGSDFEIKMNFEQTEPHWALTVYMGGPGSQSAPPPKHYTQWSAISELLDQIRIDTKVPALCAAVYHNGVEESAIVGTRRLDSPEKASISDRWLLGSITKSMTAMMIARLVDKGILTWETTLKEAFAGMPMRPEYRNVTLIQLLHHRSGLVQDLYVNPEFLAQAAGPGVDHVQMREHYTQFTLDRERAAKPDEQMLYSNAGYSVASHIAEVAAKKPYEQLMRELVFIPLGMRSARFGVPGSSGNPGGKGQLMGYSVVKNGLEPYVLAEPKWVGIQAAAGAGLSMTVGDLMRFVRYNLEGLRGHVTLMKPENFKVLHQPAITSPGGQKYACGWVIVDGLTREPYHGHNGSDGTFRSEMAIWPEKNLAIVANAGVRFEPAPPLQAVTAIYERIDTRSDKR